MDHAALDHLPFFITPPGQTDYLLIAMGIFLVGALIGVGVLYFTIHALPEHLSHGGNKIQMQIVAVLAIIALFTHQHIFWIAGLLLALVQFPDFKSPITSIARSLEKISGRKPDEPEPDEPIVHDAPVIVPAQIPSSPRPVPEVAVIEAGTVHAKKSGKV